MRPPSGDSMTASRRQILTGAATAAATALGALPSVQAQTNSSTRAPASPEPLRARRLRVGDTIGLVSPANATYEREPLEIAVESLEALGFKVKLGANVRGRYGQFGGTDVQRAADINDFFADDEVAGIL